MILKSFDITTRLRINTSHIQVLW